MSTFSIFFISLHNMYISLLRNSDSRQNWAGWQISGVKLLCFYSCLVRCVVLLKGLFSTELAINYYQFISIAARLQII